MQKKASFDQHYFDRWYRDPSQRVSTLSRTVRKAKLTLALAEYYLERPVRTVLDVGCGEGQWQPILKKLHPHIRYTGIDPSAYAIEKFGKKRNLIYGKFSDLRRLPLSQSYDLIICSDLLYYIPEPTLKSGLQLLSKHLSGVAFLEAYSSTDELEGDTQGMLPRTAQDYRRIFKQSGFTSCGSHCYVSESLAHRVTALEGTGVNLRKNRRNPFSPHSLRENANTNWPQIGEPRENLRKTKSNPWNLKGLNRGNKDSTNQKRG